MKKLLVILTLAITFVTFTLPAGADDLVIPPLPCVDCGINLVTPPVSTAFETITVNAGNGYDSNQFQNNVTTMPIAHGLNTTGIGTQGLILSGIGDAQTTVGFEGNFAQFEPFSTERITPQVEIKQNGSSYMQIFAKTSSGANYTGIDGSVSNNRAFTTDNFIDANAMTSAMGGVQCLQVGLTGEDGLVSFAALNQQATGYSVEKPNGAYQIGSALMEIQSGTFPVVTATATP